MTVENSDHPKVPTLPKSRRDLSALSSLIDDSIGKIDTYGEMYNPGQSGNPAAPPKLERQATQPPGNEPENDAQASGPDDSHGDDAIERFQITAPRSVIIATKLEALKRKTSPATIVALALRQYLKLPPNT